jgi:hypothetical protein
MSAFYLWDPYTLPSNDSVLEFVLTNGDVAYGILRAKDFVEALLADLGVKRQAKKWSLHPCRSRYFSEYLEGDDWRDVWPIVWRFQVELDGPLGALQERKDPLGTNATGHDRWDGPEKDDPLSCLVVADFRTKSDLEKAQKAILTDKRRAEMQREQRVGDPVLSYGTAWDRHWQLRVQLGVFPSSFYADGAKYARYVDRLCERAKGTTHHSKRS